MNMTIENVQTEELAEIIAGLVMKGLTFKVVPQPALPGEWKVVLTGGY
jgi:hypothetical protein